MNKKFRLAALLAVLIAIVVGGCKKKEGEDVLYRVGNDVITQDDVARVWKSFPENVQSQYMDRKGRQDLLNNMVALELMYQEGLKQKLDQEPDIKFSLERTRKNLLAQEVVERSLKIEDLYTYYQDNFIRIDGIRFKVDDPQNAAQKNAAKAKADEAYKMLISGEDFRKVKAKYNEGAAETLGYISRDGMIASYGTDAATAVFGIKKDNPKRFTTPVLTDAGWYIFLVLEYPQNLDPKGYDGVWEEIVNSKREEIFRGLITDLRNKTKVKPNAEAVEKFLKIGDEYERQGQGITGPEEQPATGATAGKPKPQAGSTVNPQPAPGATAKPKPQPGSTAKLAPAKPPEKGANQPAPLKPGPGAPKPK